MSTSSVVAEMVADASEFLDDRLDDVASFLDDVAALAETSAPAPSAELAQLLAGGSAHLAGDRARRAASGRASGPVRTRRAVAGLAAAAVSALSLTGAAAFANELPPSVQRVVAHFSEDYLPFTFPRPLGDPPVGGATTDAPTRVGGSADPVAPSERGRKEATRDSRTGQHVAGLRTRSGSTLHNPGPDSSDGAAASGQGGTTERSEPAGTGGNDATGTGADSGSDAGTPQKTVRTPPKHAFAGIGNAGKGVRPATPPRHVEDAPETDGEAAPAAPTEPRSDLSAPQKATGSASESPGDAGGEPGVRPAAG